MDFGAAPRTFATTPVQAAVRTDISIQAGSTPVELAAEKTVQSATAGEAVRLDIRGRANERRQEQTQQRQGRRDDAAARRNLDEQHEQADARDITERRLVIDQTTRSIVLQKKDPDTGETIEQLPDETMLKLRAFSRNLIEQARESAAASEHQVERTA